MGLRREGAVMDARSNDPMADAEDLLVGRRLRERRKMRRMTLEEVAVHAGISTAQLSLIERGRASPSVKGLREICRLLQIDVAWLVSEPEMDTGREAGLIVRRRSRREFSLSKKKMHKELLTPDLTGKLQFLSIAMQPGASSGPEPYNHEGEETGLVVSGRMELVVDGESFMLDAGDSFRFDSLRMHRFANAGDTVCEVLWVTTPPFY